MEAILTNIKEILMVINNFSYGGINIYMLFVYACAMTIPFFIVLRIFKTIFKKVRIHRMFVAFPSFLFTIANIFIVVLFFTERVNDYGNDAFKIFKYGPFAFCLLGYFIYKTSLKKEALIEGNIAAENSIDLMDLRGRNRQLAEKSFIEVNSDEYNELHKNDKKVKEKQPKKKLFKNIFKPKKKEESKQDDLFVEVKEPEKDENSVEIL